MLTLRLAHAKSHKTHCIIVSLFIGLTHCARAPIQDRNEALRPVDESPEINDDLPLEPLIAALQTEITFLGTSNRVKDFVFGSRVYTKDQYVAGLRHLVLQYQKLGGDRKAFLELLRSDFDFFEIYGSDSWGDAFITSYYEPIIKGSRVPTSKFRQALYKMPDDLVDIPLKNFSDELSPGSSLLPNKTLVGRLSEKPSNHGYPQVLPYYSRQEIDENSALSKKHLELCYIDPIDAFTLQIQGTGTIDFGDGQKMRVGYAAQNGHPYIALGKFLTDVIPLEKMSLRSIENYLHNLSPEKIQPLLNKNPSYVFFKELKSDPITYMGTPVVAGRTIATDEKYFPKGALGLLVFKIPRFKSASDAEASEWTESSRLVLDQDKGGAISGGGRLDLFWGSGESAKQSAGVIKEHGQLYYMAPKEKLFRL